MVFFVDDKVERIKIHVMDQDLLSNDTLGTCLVLCDKNVVRASAPLDPKGTLIYSLTLLPIEVAAGLAHNFIIPSGFTCKVLGKYNRLNVCSVIRAKVKNVEMFGKSDPYLFIRDYSPKEAHSMIEKFHGPKHENDLTPTFNETYATLLSPDCTSFKLELYDHADIGPATLLGYYEVPTGARVTAGVFPLVKTGEVELLNCSVPLELISCAAQAIQPYISSTCGGIKSGAGFSTTVYYTPGPVTSEAVVEVICKVDGAVIGEGRQVVPASGITSWTCSITPNKIVPSGKIVEITALLKVHGGIGASGALLAGSVANVKVD